MGGDHFANFLDFLWRGGIAFKQMQNQLAGRTGEHLPHQGAQQLPLYALGFTSLVDVRMLILVASHQTLREQILQELQNTGVTDASFRTDALMNFPDGRGAMFP